MKAVRAQIGAIVALIGLTTAEPNVTMTLLPNVRYQTVDGFGFCEAFQRAHAIKNLPAQEQREVLDLLLNRSTGAGMSIVRVGLGSSPNSTRDWMNSIAPQPPVSLSPVGPLEYVWDRNDSNQVWIAQEAVKYGVDMVYADAWSAPGYMKTNGRDDQGGYLCGVRGTNCTTGNWVKTYTDYLVQYVRYYLSEGVPIKYLGFVNEPNLV
jgi:O-glycosyl hydrolase